ncbi:MAG: NADH-quinone oxidoreductase subunit A [Alteromonadaceae bacterium]|nr:NADH-quinone oxidoreductase subunit A [Alteromonadaceae bacterium]
MVKERGSIRGRVVVLSNQLTEIWPIAAYFIILVVMLAFMLALSHVLGPKTKSRAKNTPYESGVIAAVAPASGGETRFGNHFFLYAIFFVIFDLETIFLFAWVIAFDEVGWAGFIEASIFIGILLVALLYIWRIGALELKHRHLPFRQQQIDAQQNLSNR